MVVGRAGASSVRLAVGGAGLFAVTSMLWLAVWALLPTAFGFQAVTIVSGSMAPTVRSGDVVLTRPPGEVLVTGNVVVFRDRDGELVTHRIDAVEADGTYRTRGDANRLRDSAPVAHGSVVGVGHVLVPLAGLPRAWLSDGRIVQVGVWVVSTLVAVAASTLLLPPTGTGRVPVPCAAPPVRRARREPGVASWSRSLVAAARGWPPRRWAGGVGVLLAIVGPLGFVTAVAAFGTTHPGNAKFSSGRWADPAVYTASEDGTVRKFDEGGLQLWQLGDRVALRDGFTSFSGWGDLPAGGRVEASGAEARSGTQSLLRAGGGHPAGGAKKLDQVLGDRWRLEAWVRRPNSWPGNRPLISFGLEDPSGNGHRASLVRNTGIRIDRADGGGATSEGVPFPVTLNVDTWYLAVLSRDGATLTLQLFSETGVPLAQTSRTDALHRSVDRLTVRGDQGYHLDDLTVWDRSDGVVGAQRAVVVDGLGEVHAAGDDRVLRRLDPEGGLTRETTDPAALAAVAVDADGHTYTASAAGVVRKRDRDGTERWSVGHPTAVHSLAVDGDGNVHTGDAAGTVRRIDPSGEVVWEVAAHVGAVDAVTVAVDGTVRTGGADGAVHALDRTGAQRWTFTGHVGAVRGLAVDRDGAVYSGGVDGTVRRLDAAGDPVWTVAGHEGAVLGIDAGGGRYAVAGHRVRRRPSPPASVLATAGSYQLQVAWDEVPAGAGAGWFETRFRAQGAPGWSDGPRVHTAEAVLTGLTSSTTYEVQVRAANDLHTSDWSATSVVTTSAASSLYSVSADGTAKRLSSEGVEEWSFAATDLVAVEVAADGRPVVLASDGTVRQRGVAGEAVWTRALPGGGRAVAVDVDGHVHVGAQDGSVHKLTASDGATLWSAATGGAAVNALAVDTDGSVHVGAADGRLHRLAADGTEVWSAALHAGAVRGVAVGRTGVVLTASDDGTVRATAPDGTALWEVDGHLGGATALVLDGDDQLFTGAGNGEIRHLDAASGAELWRRDAHAGAVRSIVIDAAGALVSGSADGVLRRSAAADGTELWASEVHAGEVRSVTADTGRYLAAGHGPRPVPAAVAGLTQDEATSGAIRLTWQSVAPGGGAAWFDVRVRAGGQTTWDDAPRVHAPATTLMALSGGSTYEIQVRAANELHRSAWTSVTVTTDPGPAAPTAFTASAGCGPAVITAVGSTTATTGTGGGTLTVPVPAGVEAGDLLLVSVGFRDTSLTLAALPPGWTLLSVQAQGGLIAGVAYRFATDDDGGSFVVTSGRAAAGGMSAYRSVDPDAPIDASATVWGGTGSTMTAPSVTTTHPGSRLVATFASGRGVVHGQVAGMTRRWEASSGSGPDLPRVSSNDQSLPSTGATGVRTSTSPDLVGDWVASMVALRAATSYQVELRWDPTPTASADGYLLERWTAGVRDPLEPWSITPVTTTSFRDTSASPMLEHEYRLLTVEAGLRSPAATALLPAQGPC